MPERKTWDSMTERERDAWVSEHVMGFVWYLGVDAGEPYDILLSPDRYGDHVSRFGPSQDRARCDNVCLSSVPRCDAPNTDYAVLCRVRDTWEAAQQRHFAYVVSGIWIERRQEARARGERTIGWECQFQPGDYSRAAFEVLTSNESEA